MSFFPTLLMFVVIATTAWFTIKTKDMNPMLEEIRLTPNTPNGWRRLSYTDARSGSMVRYPILKEPPWETDGYRIYGKLPKGVNANDAPTIWGIQSVTPKTNLKAAVADFYLLEAIIAQVPQGKVWVPPFKQETVEELVKQGRRPKKFNPTTASLYAMTMQQRLCDWLAPIIEAYMHYAQGGELTHHYWPKVYFASESENEFRVMWHEIHERFGKERAVDWAHRLFLDGENKGSWGSSFGGPAWASGTQVLKWLYAGECHGAPFGNKEFCDRSFSLQHNGGTYFNKFQWYGGLTGLHECLNAHHEGNFDVLTGYASTPVKNLWNMAFHQDVNVKLPWKLDYPSYFTGTSEPVKPSNTCGSDCDICKNELEAYKVAKAEWDSQQKAKALAATKKKGPQVDMNEIWRCPDPFCLRYWG